MLISVNLLPTEFISDQAKKANFIKIQSLGIALLLFFFFASSLIVSLRILQSQKTKQLQDSINSISQRIDQAQSKQVLLVSLKNRLDEIGKNTTNKSPQSLLYNFIQVTIPQDIIINSLSIDKSNGVNLSLTLPSVLSIDQLLNTLTSSNQIKSVSVDGINRSADGIYRLTLRLKTTK